MLAVHQYRRFKEKSEIKELQINEFIFFYLMIFISHKYKKLRFLIYFRNISVFKREKKN